MKRVLLCSIIVFTYLASSQVYSATNDPLPSWQDGQIKQSIIHFVQTVTDKNHKNYVAPNDRIATIDNDGTLWIEQPIYTQFIFLIERLNELAKKQPDLKKNLLLKPIFENDFTHLTEKNIEALFAVTSNIEVSKYDDISKKWLASAINPKFKRHYTQLIYQPMLEVLQLLKDHQFQVYIVSGGGQDFIRAFSEKTYGIPTNHVIGSAGTTSYQYKSGHATLTKQAKLLFYSNFAGKPEAINLFIGKKPILAIGNSDGDQQMLEWTQSNTLPTLMLLVHHDDADREFKYTSKTKIGTLSDKVMTFAKERGWGIISMKDDWKTIFPPT